MEFDAFNRNGYIPMQMIAMLRLSAVALVFGALAPYNADAAGEPEPITIPNANLKGVLTKSDVAQIKAHAEYWVATLAGAKTAKTVYDSREGLLADFNKYGPDSLSYKVQFARSTAAVVPAALKKMDRNDKLLALKEVNLAMAVSRIPELPIITATDALVNHKNPGVRFLGWRSYRAISAKAINTGGKDARMLFAALQKHAATEPSPIVAAVIIDVLYIKKSAWENKEFKKAFDRNYKILTTAVQPCCTRLAAGDTEWGRVGAAMIPMLKDANEYYKPDSKIAAQILQQLVTVAFAGATAYHKNKAAGSGSLHCIGLLQQAEQTLCSLTGRTDTNIRKPLFNKKSSTAEKTPAVLLGVHDWIDRLEDLGVKTPVFKPAKAPKPKPAPKPAT